MRSTLKAELRKLLSVRSTYFITILAFALLTFISLYVESFYNGKDNLSKHGNLFLANSITQHSGILAIFAAIVALLLLAHEYRYNTIMYTLTSNLSRSKVLLAKVIIVVAYTFVLVLVGTFASLGFMVLGLHLAGLSLPHQDISLLTYFAKALFYAEGYALGALLIITLVRNQVAALAILFIEPSTIEGLLSLLFKHNSVYMPFTALSQVVAASNGGATLRHKIIPATGSLSPGKGALVFCIYLAVGWLIAWVLFLKRDAN